MWESQFVASLTECGFAWVSADMIKQYLMRHITAARTVGVLAARPGTNQFYTVASRKGELLTSLLCRPTMASFFQVHSFGHLKES